MLQPEHNDVACPGKDRLIFFSITVPASHVVGTNHVHSGGTVTVGCGTLAGMPAAWYAQLLLELREQ